MRILLIFVLSFFVHFCNAQNYKIDTIWYSGNPNLKTNLTITPDGYTAAQMGQEKIDAIKARDSLFTVYPFNRNKNRYNIFMLEIVSAESGAKNNNAACYPLANPNNALGSAFNFLGICRALMGNETLIHNVAYGAVPYTDIILDMVNTTTYGGLSSGDIISYAAGNSQSYEILRHEIYHSYVGVGDEYLGGARIEEYNVTQQTDRNLVRWKGWFYLPYVGLFARGAWYVPENDCKMNHLFRPYCHICLERATVAQSYYSNPINGSTPIANPNITIPLPTRFVADVSEPTPNTNVETWTVDGVVKLTGSNTYTPTGLTNANHTITYDVYDTAYLKNYSSTHYNLTWKTQGTIPPPICQVPSNLSSTNVSQTTASLSWTGINSTKYRVQYNNIVITTTTSNVLLNNLQPQKAYTWSVKAICQADSSAYSSPQSFTTLPATPIQQLPAIDSIRTHVGNANYKVYWSAAQNYTFKYYKLRWKREASSDATYQTLNIDIASTTLSIARSLSSNQKYYLEVGIKDAAGVLTWNQTAIYFVTSTGKLYTKTLNQP